MTQTIRKKWRILPMVILLLLGTVFLLVSLVFVALSTQSGNRWVVSQLVARLNQVGGYSLNFQSMDGTLVQGLQLRGLTFVNPDVDIALGEIQISWNPYSILSGNVYLSELRLSDAILIPTGSDGAVESSASPVEVGLFNPPGFSIEIGTLEITRAELRLQQQRLQLDSFTTNARLNGLDLALSNAHLRSPQLILNGDAQIYLSNFFPMNASLDWRAEINSLKELSGSVSLVGNIDSLEIENRLLEPAAVRSTGSVKTGLGSSALAFDLTHKADDFRYLQTLLDNVVLNAVILRTSGNPAEIFLELSSNIETDYLPTLQFSGNAIYTDRHLDLNSYSISTASGNVIGSADLAWVENLQGSLNYQSSHQNPLNDFDIDFELPLDLTEITSSGTWSFELLETGVRGELELDAIAGKIGPYNLTGNGALGIEGNTVSISQLVLETDSNQLLLQGEIADSINIDWSINAPELQQVLTGLQGSAIGSGRLTGSVADPTIVLQIAAADLQYADYAIAELNLSLDRTNAVYQAAIELTEASIATSSIQEELASVLIQIQGLSTRHSLSVDIESGYGSLLLALEGGIPDQAALEWQGTLLEVSLDSAIGTWSSNSTASISVSESSINLRNNCWEQREAQLCIDLQRQAGQEIQLAASLQGYVIEIDSSTPTGVVDLASFLPESIYLPENLSLHGTVNATLNLLLAANLDPVVDITLLSSDAEFTIKAIQQEQDNDLLEDELSQDQQYTLNVVDISGQSREGHWDFSSNISFSRQNIDESDLGLTAAINSRISIDAENRLSGTANLELEDLAWVEAILPEISNTHGNLSGEIVLAGSLGQPAVTGNLVLENGEFSILRSGITLSEINTRINSTSVSSLNLSGELTSGPGKIDFDGEINNLFSVERRLAVQISGNDFQVADLPDLQLNVSPELHLIANREAIDLGGSLLLPVLNLQLIQLPEAAVDISRDAIVVRYPPDRPELARSISSSQGTLFDIPVTADVEIVLGEQVNFRGFGLNADLEGSLGIQQQANGANLTYGELNVSEGTYQIYGQTLQLRQGKLLFFGAYDNPALDVRAVREIEEVTVGVLMNGTLKNINSQLYSTPALAENDIIAMLATGRPFSEVGNQDSAALLGVIARLGINRGQSLTNQIKDQLGLDTLGVDTTNDLNNSVLTIGKYLTPDIFVRYGYGLFDRQTKLAIDYALSERIKLQAESGEYQSVDITYTVER
ncbi:MAG: translocation/assembly module TamB domain-containing protein [Proteobacteria bacterium]|nr:translocation/assembly module TamB domain-containing protein [Pseudomonadota bacterium]